MADIVFPHVNYKFVSPDGRNLFREKFGSLPDDAWGQILIRSISEGIIEGIEFPRYPEDETQNSIHGHHGAISVGESVNFYKYVKSNTYKDAGTSGSKRILDFGSGWGRIIRPFMRDFEFADLYGFEPNFLLCALARSLNPYVMFFSGTYVPTGNLPAQFFDLVFGWSVFSHLSQASAVLWLREAARIVVPGGWCVFTTWGDRFLKRLKDEADQRKAGKQIHWYSSVCIDAAVSIDQRLSDYQNGDFVWFTSGKSTLYGEAFVSKDALRRLLLQYQLPFEIQAFDKAGLPQDAFVLKRL
jgi:SAM-dependent methyltransferase